MITAVFGEKSALMAANHARSTAIAYVKKTLSKPDDIGDNGDVGILRKPVQHYDSLAPIPGRDYGMEMAYVLGPCGANAPKGRSDTWYAFLTSCQNCSACSQTHSIV